MTDEDDGFYRALEDDFCESFATPESRKSHMFVLFADGYDIYGVDRARPRVKALLEMYWQELVTEAKGE